MSSHVRKNSDHPAFKFLLERSMNELQAKTAAHDASWHLAEADWSVDQDTGEIVFDAPNGVVATAPVQIIGTYNSIDGTWLWSWDNPSIEPELQSHALQVRDYGEKHEIDQLTTRKFACTEDDAWLLTALACKLCGAQGAYRGPADSTFIFMTFGAVSIQKNGEKPT